MSTTCRSSVAVPNDLIAGGRLTVSVRRPEYGLSSAESDADHLGGQVEARNTSSTGTLIGPPGLSPSSSLSASSPALRPFSASGCRTVVNGGAGGFGAGKAGEPGARQCPG